MAAVATAHTAGGGYGGGCLRVTTTVWDCNGNYPFFMSRDPSVAALYVRQVRQLNRSLYLPLFVSSVQNFHRFGYIKLLFSAVMTAHPIASISNREGMCRLYSPSSSACHSPWGGSKVTSEQCEHRHTRPDCNDTRARTLKVATRHTLCPDCWVLSRSNRLCSTHGSLLIPPVGPLLLR